MGYYRDEKKVEAATLYAVLGKVKETSELTGVPEQRLREWLRDDWFCAIIEEVREENNQKLDAKFTEIVETALEGLNDRLKNGDHVMSPRGEVTRMPVKAKDLASIVSGQLEKRELLRGKPTQRTESQQSTPEATLKLLAEQFISLAQQGKKPKTIEAEVVEVIEETEYNAESTGTSTETASQEERPVG